MMALDYPLIVACIGTQGYDGKFRLVFVHSDVGGQIYTELSRISSYVLPVKFEKLGLVSMSFTIQSERSKPLEVLAFRHKKLSGAFCPKSCIF